MYRERARSRERTRRDRRDRKSQGANDRTHPNGVVLAVIRANEGGVVTRGRRGLSSPSREAAAPLLALETGATSSLIAIPSLKLEAIPSLRLEAIPSPLLSKVALFLPTVALPVAEIGTETALIRRSRRALRPTPRGMGKRERLLIESKTALVLRRAWNGGI